jgi:hypothetical protein
MDSEHSKSAQFKWCTHIPRDNGKERLQDDSPTCVNCGSLHERSYPNTFKWLRIQNWKACNLHSRSSRDSAQIAGNSKRIPIINLFYVIKLMILPRCLLRSPISHTIAKFGPRLLKNLYWELWIVLEPKQRSSLVQNGNLNRKVIGNL